MEHTDEFIKEFINTPEDSEEWEEINEEFIHTPEDSEEKEEKIPEQRRDRCRWLAYFHIVCLVLTFVRLAVLILGISGYGNEGFDIEEADALMDGGMRWIYTLWNCHVVVRILESLFVIYDIIRLKTEAFSVTFGMCLCIVFTPFYLSVRKKQKKTSSACSSTCIICWGTMLPVMATNTMMLFIWGIVAFFRALRGCIVF